MYKLGDIYEENEVYYIILEISNIGMGPYISRTMPLSRWILLNMIGTIQDAVIIFEKMKDTSKQKQ